MAGVVVPFRGPDGKSRLDLGSDEARAELARAMLADVLAASAAIGPAVLVSSAPGLDVEAVPDPGRGQGAAVEAGLARVRSGPVLVVNADLPCVSARDLFALLGTLPADGVAVAPAADGTTNALALARPGLFASLYGPGSAERFREHAARLGVACAVAEVPNLADDVDTLEDLARVEGRVGPRTRAVLDVLRAGAVT